MPSEKSAEGTRHGWECKHCGWFGDDPDSEPDWEEYEDRPICPECGDPVKREVKGL